MVDGVVSSFRVADSQRGGGRYAAVSTVADSILEGDTPEAVEICSENDEGNSRSEKATHSRKPVFAAEG